MELIEGARWYSTHRADPRLYALYRRQTALYDVILRLADRVLITPDGCWLWTGHTLQGGYGQVWVGKQMMLVHRLFYEFLVEAVPDGKQLHHRCERANCVAVTHLQVVSPKEHVALTPQGITGRLVGATHCKRGHEFTPENTILDKKGGRRCRTCHREINLASWHRRQARQRAPGR